MNNHPLLPPNIEYNPLKHGEFIGIEYGCFVFKEALGRWYCWYNPQKMYQSPRWVFHRKPGFQMSTPAPGISPNSWNVWVTHEQNNLQGKPLHLFHKEEDGQEIENEWTPPSSVVITKMFGVERPSYVERCYLEQKIQQFARLHPERVKEEEHKDVHGSEGAENEEQSVEA